MYTSTSERTGYSMYVTLSDPLTYSIVSACKIPPPKAKLPLFSDPAHHGLRYKCGHWDAHEAPCT